VYDDFKRVENYVQVSQMHTKPFADGLSAVWQSERLPAQERQRQGLGQVGQGRQSPSSLEEGQRSEAEIQAIRDDGGDSRIRSGPSSSANGSAAKTALVAQSYQ